MPNKFYRTRANAVAELCAHLSAAKAGNLEPSVTEIEAWGKSKGIELGRASILRYAKAFGVNLKQRRRGRPPGNSLPLNYDRPRVVALCLRSLYKELGVPLPPALKYICEGRAVPDFEMAMTYPGGVKPEGEKEVAYSEDAEAGQVS